MKILIIFKKIIKMKFFKKKVIVFKIKGNYPLENYKFIGDSEQSFIEYFLLKNNIFIGKKLNK